ncbi:uncharacterized protein LOC126691999 isoform X5 [Quercus robur]|uniref:uncharacterized protein LOC126691999 isoform X5 n=1 Tax=Quercus robur TaxID=38942 RepID=UPI00216295C9|nr:uncharacterized protein LOC126691999 isoform X5 [Quercus robur]
MGKKEGEKNGGGNKVAPAPAPAEKKDDVSVTAVYKINCNCNGCVEKIEKALRHFDGVEEVKIDRDACELTVKGTNLDLTAIREKLEKEIKKKFELVSPQPKKGGGGGGGGGYKKPEKKKAEKKEEPKKPKELRDELHKEILQLARENLENEPPIMELRNQKEGEKNGGDNKVAPAEKKDVVSVTAIYKIDCNCEGCVEKIKKALCHFDGVEELKIDCNKLTVKGTNLDPTAIREKLEKEIKKKFELVSTQPKKGGGGGGGGYKKPEKKKAEKKEEPKKPKELRDELHKETLQLARENLENEPPIMELRNQKEGEKNSGDNKVAQVQAPVPVPAEKKDDIFVTAIYKIDCNCEGCAEKIKKALCHFDGVEELRIDCNKLTVKGTNLEPTAIREKLEKEIKKKFELVSPQPKKGSGGGCGYKKPKEKKAENKEEPKKPKELMDELHKETLQLARENLENKPPIMELRNQPRPQDGSSQSWYPPSVVSSPNSSRPGTPSSASSSSFSSHRTSDRPQSPSHVSPAEAAGIIAVLKDKSVDELRKLLSDKDAYHHFLLSLDQVKIQNNSRDELRKETLQLARENLEKEPRIMELRNQCRIIRTTELAAAQEKLNELERKKEETLKFYSPQSLLQRLQDANKTEEESENLHKQLLDRDVDLGTFVQKYKKLRTTYHRRALIHLSAKTSSIG